MLDNDPVERNRLSRIFRGRLVELQLAMWLEAASCQIIGLEATHEGSDIETVSPDGVINSFEVKFVGVEDRDFKIFLESLAGLPAGAFVSPYIAINYLLFRVYEAACQLRNIAGTKTIVVVIADTTWSRFDVQLDNNWIDWKNPAFVREDQEWKEFVEKQRKRHPNLRNNLGSTLQVIDSIKIFVQNLRFEFVLKREISPKLLSPKL